MKLGTLTMRVAARLVLPLLLRACCAGAAEGQPGVSPPDFDEAAVERVESQIFTLQNRLDGLQMEEYQLQMAMMKAEGAAAQDLAEPHKAAEQIAEGSVSPGLRRYREAVLRSVQEWQTFRGRYAGFARTLRPLERQREGLPPQVQAKIDALVARAEAKDRSLLARIANLYEKIAEYRSAMAACMAVYQAIPPDRRDGERALKEQIAGLAEKCGDYGVAVAVITSIMEARPEKDRYGDKRLGERLGDLYAKSGDLGSAFLTYKATFEAIDEESRYRERGLGEKLGDLCEQAGYLADALELYRRLYEAIPESNRVRDGASLQARIAALERKLGLSRAPPPARKGDDDDERHYPRGY
ncbi:MAG: hypothetical protein IMZ44_17010 [Planctomycetes bacterium]|nr:hypothetical protein [Planctomycetota bacterium]